MEIPVLVLPSSMKEKNVFICPAKGARGLGSSWLKHTSKQRPLAHWRPLVGVVRVYKSVFILKYVN
jgi:hypothetical protein